MCLCVREVKSERVIVTQKRFLSVELQFHVPTHVKRRHSVYGNAPGVMLARSVMYGKLKHHYYEVLF